MDRIESSRVSSEVLEKYQAQAIDAYETARVQLQDNDLVVVIFDCEEEKGIVADTRSNLLSQTLCPSEIRESIKAHPCYKYGLTQVGLGFWLCVFQDEYLSIFGIIRSMTTGGAN
jgi:hypothetical protein